MAAARRRGLIMGFVAFLTLAYAAWQDSGMAVIETALVGLGCGLGLVMPTLTVAIQNSVERRHLGVATSVSAFVGIGPQFVVQKLPEADFVVMAPGQDGMRSGKRPARICFAVRSLMPPI